MNEKNCGLNSGQAVFVTVIIDSSMSTLWLFLIQIQVSSTDLFLSLIDIVVTLLVALPHKSPLAFRWLCCEHSFRVKKLLIFVWKNSIWAAWPNVSLTQLDKLVYFVSHVHSFFELFVTHHTYKRIDGGARITTTVQHDIFCYRNWHFSLIKLSFFFHFLATTFFGFVNVLLSRFGFFDYTILWFCLDPFINPTTFLWTLNRSLFCLKRTSLLLLLLW